MGPVAGNNANSPANGELTTIAGKPAGRFPLVQLDGRLHRRHLPDHAGQQF